MGLDVLYEWRTVMKDGGEAFYRFWRSLLGRYSAPLPELRAAMQLRSQFEGACMDFMQLQGQDYEGSFWCEHMEVRAAGGGCGCGSSAVLASPWCMRLSLQAVPPAVGGAGTAACSAAAWEYRLAAQRG